MAAPDLQRLTGWGRHPSVLARERVGEDLERLTENVVLTRGLGRSYGDASLPPAEGDVVANTRLADRFIAFDGERGVLRAEAGLPLWRVQERLLPRGWSCPVLPGTGFVTLGGMVAADVHGKNHHVAGTIGCHVRALRIRTGDGRVLDAGPELEPELFRATIGGMGLTGHVLEVELALARIGAPWIVQRTERTRDLEHLLERLPEVGRTWPFTAGWADLTLRGVALGRGLLFAGRWAEPAEAGGRTRAVRRPWSVPVDMPDWLLRGSGVRVFNRLYEHLAARDGIVAPGRFFHPLDGLGDWNRMYGRRGFLQYQFVLPGRSTAAVRRVIERLGEHGVVPYLTVIKDFGDRSAGTLSFPMPGVTVALDFPVDGDRTRSAVRAANEIVAAEGGRVYLAKDALSTAEEFRAMEPRLDAFASARRRFDPAGRVSSALGVRLLGDAA